MEKKEEKKIFIVGAGNMGCGIAQTAASNGLSVILQDLEQTHVDAGYASIKKRFERNIEKGKITSAELDTYLNNIATATRLEDAADADLVIEAAPEDEEIKCNIFRRLDEICNKKTILASNTSSIPITSIASATKRQEKVIGTHFFYPVPVMKLLEIVIGYNTSEETYLAVKAVGEQMGKITIKAKDKAGFIVNRLMDPLINEAVNLVDEGICTPEDIDKGMKFGYNHPMGPLEIGDMSGWDMQLAIMEVLYYEFRDPKYRPAPLIRKMVRAGHLGVKTGQGFYTYKDGKRV